jgi:hypothetical protein
MVMTPSKPVFAPVFPTELVALVAVIARSAPTPVSLSCQYAQQAGRVEETLAAWVMTV